MTDNGLKNSKTTVNLTVLTYISVLILAIISLSGCYRQEKQGDNTDKGKDREMYGEIADLEIIMSFGEDDEKLIFNDIREWVSAEKKNDEYIYNVNAVKLRDYTEWLSDKYSNYQSSITFTTAYGEKKTVGNDNLGWVFDSDYAFDMLKDYISKAKSVKLDLTSKTEESNKWWKRTGEEKYSLNNDSTFAEVSLEKQYMWVRQDNKIIFESPVVTGAPVEDRETPEGAYAVYEKKSPAVLSGPSWSTEVYYWMAFNGAIGFHDTDVQESFGGDTYLYSGSHGCINLPLNAAKKLYGIVSVGFPVYVY